MIQHIKIQRIIDSSAKLPDADLVRYKGQLEDLLGSIEGSIPGSRGFGLENRYLDAPSGGIANLLVMDLAEKCEKYIPAISVDEVKVDSGKALQGELPITITISLTEESTNKKSSINLWN